MRQAVKSLEEMAGDIPINMIIQQSKQSVAKNVNDGARQAKSDWFVVWNDDWEATQKGWLDRICAVAQDANTDKCVKFISTVFRTPATGKIVNHRGYYISTNGIAGALFGDEVPADGVIEKDYAHPVLIEREAFNTLKGYDEKFKGSQFADMDFMLRAGKAGYKTYMMGSVNIYHHYSENRETNGIRQLNRHNNEIIFRAKHGFTRKKGYEIINPYELRRR